MGAQFEISRDIEGGVGRAVLAGEFDLVAAPQLRAEVHALVDDAAVTQVVVDVSLVTFIDSGTVGVFIGCRNHALTVGKVLRVVGAVGRVRRVLDVMGLTALLAGVDPPHR